MNERTTFSNYRSIHIRERKKSIAAKIKHTASSYRSPNENERKRNNRDAKIDAFENIRNRS
jgi:hypothetical protein